MSSCPYHSSEDHLQWGSPGVKQEVKKRIRLVDILVIIYILVMITVFHLFFSSRPEWAVLNTESPTIVSIYFSNFFHFDSQHLIGNLAAYVLVVPYAYITSILSNRRRHFIYFFGFMMLIYPFLSSIINLFVFQNSTKILGFSSILMGFLGYSILAKIGFIGARISDVIDLDHAPLLFFLGNLTILSLGISLENFYIEWILLITVTGTIYFYYLGIKVTEKGWWGENLRNYDFEMKEYIDLVIFGLIIYFSVLLAGFSPSSGEINVFGHLAGYSIGFSIGYIVLRTDCAISHICHCASPSSNCRIHKTSMNKFLRYILLKLGLC